MQIAIDPSQESQRRSRSLRMMFQVRSNLETINVSQLVPVKPQTEYEFECYVSTDKLESWKHASDSNCRCGRRKSPLVSQPRRRVAPTTGIAFNLHFQDWCKDGSSNS